MIMYYMYNYPYYPVPYWQIRQYPKVDVKQLNQSANQSKKLMDEASVVLDTLAASGKFGTELMNAAQASDKEKVKQLIHSIKGVTSEVDVDYTPDSLQLEFKSNVAHMHCCRLSLSLRWR